MDILSMKQERARLVNEMQAIHKAASDESRSLTAEDRQTFDRIAEEARELKGDIDRLETLRDLGPADLPAAAAGAQGRNLTGAEPDKARRTDEYRSAWDAYMRRGRFELTADQRAALAAGEEDRADMLDSGATSGGYLVPVSFANQVISKKIPRVAVRRTRATVFPTSNGQDLPVPVQSAYGAAAYLTEGAAGSSVADTGAKVTLKAWTAVRETGVSFQLMQDSAFPFEGVLSGNIANSFALFEDAEFVKGAGSGSSAITGITSCAVGTTTGTGHLPNFTYTELNAWYYSLGPAYRSQGEFVLNDGSLAVLAGLVDAQNRPIWTAGQIPGEPDTLFGKPLYTSPAFVTPAAGTIVGVFGDFANGYGIREVDGIKVLRSDERRIDQLETLFVSYERLDGNLLDAAALVSLKLAAS
jgi:HK97 family phage major capsid protein